MKEIKKTDKDKTAVRKIKGKKASVFSFFMILALLLCCNTGWADSAQTEAMMTGGWKNVPHEAEELPEGAQEAFDKATENMDGAEYTPVALLSEQLVTGMNYCILCQITPVVPNAEPNWALVYIYADLEGNAEITNVYELYIAQHSTPKE